MKTSLKNYTEHNIEKLNGIYRGVVEDNSSDPLKLGRCKIRVFEVHSPNKKVSEMDGIPTDELPWAEPALSLFEGSVSGFGAWTIPLQGSHVFLFFEGGNILKPRYFASAPGIPTDKNHGYTSTQGFSDPSGTYPTSGRLNESDVHRLARGETSQTVVSYRTTKLELAVIQALAQGIWNEPAPSNSTEYPHNIVYATHGGLAIEIDSTAGAKRFHVYHPSNTYVEVDNDGVLIIANESDRYDITRKNKNELVKMNSNENININKTKKIGLNEFIEIGMNQMEQIGMNRTTIIGMNDTQNVGLNKTITIGVTSTEMAGALIIKRAPLILLN